MLVPQSPAAAPVAQAAQPAQAQFQVPPGFALVPVNQQMPAG